MNRFRSFSVLAVLLMGTLGGLAIAKETHPHLLASYPLSTDTGSGANPQLSYSHLVASGSVVVADLNYCQGGDVQLYDSNGGLATVQLAAGGKTVRAVVATYPASGTGTYVSGTAGTGQYGVTVANTGHGYDLTVTSASGATVVNVSSKANLVSNSTVNPSAEL